MDQYGPYIQEILDVLWDIDRWAKDPMRDTKNLRKLIREYDPDQVDLVALARDMDWWVAKTPDIQPDVALLRSFAKKAIARGEAKPYSLSIMGAALSVEEQVRLMELKRKQQLAAMGTDDGPHR
jgi:hypothetical protein